MKSISFSNKVPCMIHLLISVVATLFLTSQVFSQIRVLGSKPEVLDSDLNAPPPIATMGLAFTINSGESRTFGPAALASASGWGTYSYVWSCQEGSLETLTPEFNHIRYRAPIVSVTTTDTLFLWIGGSSGKTTEAAIAVTVLPTTTGGQEPSGQITAVYNSESSNFTVNYTLDSTVTRAWIMASTDGVSYSQVSAIDPVTTSNRSGSRIVTVAGSGSCSQVWFQLKTQAGAFSAIQGDTTLVAYTPPPTLPKSGEIPTTPNLIINGWQVSQPSVYLSWGRVNDSFYRDNVNYYEVQYATNQEFTGAMLINVGNNASGQNIFESASYTVTGLLDNHSYYFRVRAVNNVGAGPWSNVDAITVNIQDGPVFDAQPVFPTNGATGVSKTPALEFLCSDSDGDTVDYYIYYGTSPTTMFRLRGFGDPSWRGSMQLDPSEWNSQLTPNTRYYWRVEAREEGRDKAYYGGSYPSSPIWEFVTENTGSNLGFSNVTLTSGTIKPEAELTYRMTVTNNGNVASGTNFVVANYVKNGSEALFKGMDWVPVPALNPGQSVNVDVKIRFKNEVFVSPEGITYDNVLMVGSSAIRFYTFYNDQSLGSASYTLPITYANAGGPVFQGFILSNNSGGNKNGVPRGGVMSIYASILDDVRTTRSLIEYRLNMQSQWLPLDDYTGNTTQIMRFGQSSHSGTTVSSPTNNTSITWAIPANFPLTSTLEIRITAYDDQGTTSYGISPVIRIYDDTLVVAAGATDFSSYWLGGQARIPVSVTTPMTISSYSVRYRTSVGGNSGDLLQVTWDGINGLQIPPVLSVTLPNNPYMASENGILEIIVGASSGVGGRSVTDASDNSFSLRLGDLPAPFHEATSMPLSGAFSFPVGSTSQSTWVVGKAADWEGEDALHIVAEEGHSYTLAGVPYSPDPIRFWFRFDRANKTFTKATLPAGFDVSEIKLIGTTPYVLMQSGNGAYLTWKSGAGFVAPQLIESHTLLYGDEHGLVKRGINELYYSFTANRNQSSSLRRNRIRRIVPSVGTTIEHPGVWHGYYPCYGTHLSGFDGIYNLNSDLSLGTPVATWTPPPYYPFRFTNTSGPVVGARLFGDVGSVWLETYDQAGLSSRWNTPFERANVKSFASWTICVGSTPSGRPDSEGQMVVRRQHGGGLEQSVLVGNRPGNNDGHKQSAISDGGLVAVMWNTATGYFAIGNMSGDITAPDVQITTADSGFSTGQAKDLAWTVSDNLNQLASVKVLKVVGGVSTQIANYTSGTFPTSLNYTFNDTTASVIVRVEAYDQSGNRGVAEKVMTRSGAFTFTGFTAASYSVPMGTAAQLVWTVSTADAYRIYNVLTRPLGGAAWITSGSVTGTSFLLDTSLLSGTLEVRIESGGVTRDLTQPLVISGNWFAFDNTGFSPASGTAYVAAGAPLLSLMWESNQPVSTSVPYTVLCRWNGTGSYSVLGSTTEKSLEVNAGTNTALEWKVVALWEGLEFTSATRSVTLATVAGGPAPVAVVVGRTTADPWVDLNWPAVAGSEAMVIYRHDTRTDTVEELARVSGTSYRDEAVTWGDDFSYTLATVLGDVVSLPGAAASVTISPLLPLGVSFVNANYQTAPGNSYTLQWNPVLPVGATEVFEDYQVYLRRGDGSIARAHSVTPAAGTAAQTTWTGLEYNQSFVVEVFALHPDGSRLGTEPVRLYFSTGFDTRMISTAAAVAVPVVDFFGVNLTWIGTANADCYDIFRRINGGALTWIGRSYSTSFADAAVPPGTSAAWVVRARNNNTYTDSTPTATAIREVFRITGMTRAGNSGQDIVLTFPGYTGATYRVQQSTTLAPDSWTDTGVAAPGIGNPQSLTLPNAVTNESGVRRFYRVVGE